MNLKEVLISKGNRGNQFIKDLQSEIEEVGNRLFLYHLVHAYEDKLDIDCELKNRNKELCEGLQLLQGLMFRMKLNIHFKDY